MEGVDRLANNQKGITIGTISGGIVNFGGAVWIAPISVTTTTSGSGNDNSGTEVSSSSRNSASLQRNITEIIELIQAMNKKK
jgi:hypothetical protein